MKARCNQVSKDVLIARSKELYSKIEELSMSKVGSKAKKSSPFHEKEYRQAYQKAYNFPIYVRVVAAYNSGVPNKVISKMTGYVSSTVATICRKTDLEEYKKAAEKIMELTPENSIAEELTEALEIYKTLFEKEV